MEVDIFDNREEGKRKEEKWKKKRKEEKRKERGMKKGRKKEEGKNKGRYYRITPADSNSYSTTDNRELERQMTMYFISS